MHWHALAAACPHVSAAYTALLPTQLSCCSHSSTALTALLPSQLRCSHSSAAFTAPLSTQLYCLHSSAVPTAPLPSQLRCARRPAALTAQVLSRLRCAHGSLVYRPASGERVLPASTCGFAQLPLLLPLLLLPHTRCCLCSPRRYCRLLRCCSAVHALARLRAPALASYVRALTRRASFHEPCSLLSATRFRALHARLPPPLWPGGAERSCGASRVHLPSPLRPAGRARLWLGSRLLRAPTLGLPPPPPLLLLPLLLPRAAARKPPRSPCSLAPPLCWRTHCCCSCPLAHLCASLSGHAPVWLRALA